MSGSTNIQWTQKTWNGGIFGCTKVSEGCRNCYAMTMAARIAGAADARERAGGTPTARQAAYQKVVIRRKGKPIGQWNNTIVIDADDPEILAPMRVRKPSMWFVDSMHDWFHDGVPFEHLDRLYAVMACCPQHVFQILTKRPERMAEYLTTPDRDRAIEQAVFRFHEAQGPDYRLSNALPVHPLKVAESLRVRGRSEQYAWLLPNVWLGTSCEDQETWDERVPELRHCPAAVRFVSCEPLLGDIDTDLAHGCRGCNHPGNIMPCWNDKGRCSICDGSRQEPSDIHWVIVGGESGPNARPMDPAWARWIRDQCAAANGVAFFMKQMGGRSGHKGAMDDLPEDLRIREFPVTRHTQQRLDLRTGATP